MRPLHVALTNKHLLNKEECVLAKVLIMIGANLRDLSVVTNKLDDDDVLMENDPELTDFLRLPKPKRQMNPLAYAFHTLDDLNLLVPFMNWLIHHNHTLFNPWNQYQSYVNEIPTLGNEESDSNTLFHAIGKGEQMVKFLLENGANPNATIEISFSKTTLLHEAVRKLAEKDVKTLLDYGASIYNLDSNRFKPIDLLNVTIKEMLLEEQDSTTRNQIYSKGEMIKKYLTNYHVSNQSYLFKSSLSNKFGFLLLNLVLLITFLLL